MTRIYLLAATAVLTLAACATPNSQAIAGCGSPGQEVHEETFVAIGGIEQWITIKGESCANPVVLFLHGGPGNPLSPYADSIYRGWEETFTLVQWDQRGAGRTFGRNESAVDSTLTIGRMVEDGIQVAMYLTERLGKEKIILTGASWGSVLGVHMAKARPDLFEAYVGVYQMVNHRENLTDSYANVLALARQDGDEGAISTLEALGPPPWTNPRSFGILRRAIRGYEAKTSTPAPESWWLPAPAYDTPQVRAAYTDGEDFSYLQFVGFNGDGMLSQVDLPALGMNFEIPVFIIQGSEDLLTTPGVARRYFDGITAPRKEFVLVPRTGHGPNMAMVETIFGILTDVSEP